MVGRKKKRKQKKPSLGNHQRSWIWGQHAVLEMLRAGRWKPDQLLICQEFVEQSLTEEVIELCQSMLINYQIVENDEIGKQISTRDHQGLAAKMPTFPTLTLDKLLGNLPPNPFLLILDRIQDPYNFGSMLRSADLFGVDGIIIGERKQVGVSSHVARSSVGAVNYLNIAVVHSLTDAIGQLVEKEFQIIAATEKGHLPPAEINLVQPLAVIMGNEGNGIQSELLEMCSQQCRIPQSGHIDSLNAAVAAGILCYEVHRQRSSQ